MAAKDKGNGRPPDPLIQKGVFHLSPSRPDPILFYRRLARLLPPRASLLDLACGDGVFLREALARGATRALGVEISESGVLNCVQSGLSVYHGDITEGLTSYPDGSFDCVSLIRTLELLPKPEPVLDEMLRVGREVLVTFTNFGHLRHGLRYLFTGTVPGAVKASLGGPPSRLTLPLFRKYCRSHAIEIVQITPLPLTWRARVLPSLFAREFAVRVRRALNSTGRAQDPSA